MFEVMVFGVFDTFYKFRQGPTNVNSFPPSMEAYDNIYEQDKHFQIGSIFPQIYVSVPIVCCICLWF